MKPAQKKKIEPKKIERKKENAKAKRMIAKKPAYLEQKPKVLIAAKIRPKILNLKAVEAEKPAAPVAGKTKTKEKESEFEIKKTKIRIVGIGGGGGNIVSEIAQKLKKSSFYIANTDYQALRNAPKNVTIFQFGEKFTHGLGTGMDARIAEEAAGEDKETIKKMLEGQDLVIIVSSLGGGTGSGAAPVFAQISKSLGNLTYGIFTLPFVFEGAKKNEIARNALDKLRPYLNAITILPNERVFEVVPKNTPFSKTLSHVNATLSGSLEGLVETIYDTGVINIDFADLRTILAGNGKMAFLNTVVFKKGEQANLDSFEKAFSSPLYPYTIDKAKGLLLNIVAAKDLKLVEVNKILTGVANRIHKEAKIIFGVSHEGAAEGSVRVTVLATGCVYEGGDSGDKEIIKQPKDAANESAIPVPPRPVPAKKQKPDAVNPMVQPAGRQKGETKKIKTSGNDNKKKKSAAKKQIPVKIKDNPAAEKRPQNNKSIVVSGQGRRDDDGLAVSIENYQNQQSIAAQFENPVRKNALQVKKEVEMEEREMLEKEKAWEVPAFLRKQKK
ncbi:MAG: cell division protein FtsZ [Candidatus Paceibacterota bacterium]